MIAFFSSSVMRSKAVKLPNICTHAAQLHGARRECDRESDRAIAVAKSDSEIDAYLAEPLDVEMRSANRIRFPRIHNIRPKVAETFCLHSQNALRV
jgi:hypothetical protein